MKGKRHGLGREGKKNGYQRRLGGTESVFGTVREMFGG